MGVWLDLPTNRSEWGGKQSIKIYNILGLNYHIRFSLSRYGLRWSLNLTWVRNVLGGAKAGSSNNTIYNWTFGQAFSLFGGINKRHWIGYWGRRWDASELNLPRYVFTVYEKINDLIGCLVSWSEIGSPKVQLFIGFFWGGKTKPVKRWVMTHHLHAICNFLG